MQRRSSQKSRLKVFLSISLVVLIAGGMIFQVWLRVRIRQMANEVEVLKVQMHTFDNQINTLQAKANNLSSYENITRKARNELGMIFLEQEQQRIDK